MKIMIIVLFSVILSVNVLIGNSYGQTTEAQKTKGSTEVFIQIQLRNSDGTLVGYVEGNPQIFYLDQVINWVEPRSHKSTIVKDGEIFELMQFEDKLSWSEAQSMGAYFLILPEGTALYFHHDSFLVLPGDTAQVFWTVIRSSG